MSTIVLVPIGSVSDKLLHRLLRRVSEVFRTSASLFRLPLNPASAFDSYRNQYNSTLCISLLLKNHEAQEYKILGVTDYDLFVPVLTYVFGEAQLNGRAAVVSSFRLRPELYGLPVDDALVECRLEKEAIHELGHAYGLIHCNNDRCVMHSSTYAEDIDLKNSIPCSGCLVQLFSKISTASSHCLSW